MSSIDPESKLFAQLFLDPEIRESPLEGNHLVEVAGPFRHFLEEFEKTPTPPGALALGQNIFADQSPTTPVRSRELKDLKKALFMMESARGDAKAIAASLMELKEGQSIYMPGGYMGFSGGHAMIYEFSKAPGGKGWVLLVYNSGNGIDYHNQSLNPQGTKHLYEQVVAYHIPEDLGYPPPNLLDQKAKTKKMQDFVQELLNPILPDSPIKGVKSRYLYEVVFEKVRYLGGNPLPSAELKGRVEWLTPQRSGTCVQKSLNQIIGSFFTEKGKEKSKALRYAYKLYFLESYINRYQARGTIDSERKVLIQKAITNLAKAASKDLAKLKLSPELRKEVVAFFDIQREKLASIRVVDPAKARAASRPSSEPIIIQNLQARHIDSKSKGEAQKFLRPIAPASATLTQELEAILKDSTCHTVQSIVQAVLQKFNLEESKAAARPSDLKKTLETLNNALRLFNTPPLSPQNFPIVFALMVHSLRELGKGLPPGTPSPLRLWSPMLLDYLKKLKTVPQLASGSPELELLLRQVEGVLEEQKAVKPSAQDFARYYARLIPESEKARLLNLYQTHQDRFHLKMMEHIRKNKPGSKDPSMPFNCEDWCQGDDLLKIFLAYTVLDTESHHAHELGSHGLQYGYELLINQALDSISNDWGGMRQPDAPCFEVVGNPPYANIQFKSLGFIATVEKANLTHYIRKSLISNHEKLDAMFAKALEDNWGKGWLSTGGEEIFMRIDGPQSSSHQIQYHWDGSPARDLKYARSNLGSELENVLGYYSLNLSKLDKKENQTFLFLSVFQPGLLLEKLKDKDKGLQFLKEFQKFFELAWVYYDQDQSIETQLFVLALGTQVYHYAYSQCSIPEIRQEALKQLQKLQEKIKLKLEHFKTPGLPRVELLRASSLIALDQFRALDEKADNYQAEKSKLIEQLLELRIQINQAQSTESLNHDYQKPRSIQEWEEALGLQILKIFKTHELEVRRHLPLLLKKYYPSSVYSLNLQMFSIMDSSICELKDSSAVFLPAVPVTSYHFDFLRGDLILNSVCSRPLPPSLVQDQSYRDIIGTTVPAQFNLKESSYSFSHKGREYRAQEGSPPLIQVKIKGGWYTLQNKSPLPQSNDALTQQSRYRWWVSFDGSAYVEDLETHQYVYTYANSRQSLTALQEVKGVLEPLASVDRASSVALKAKELLSSLEDPRFIEILSFVDGSKKARLPHYGMCFDLDAKGSPSYTLEGRVYSPPSDQKLQEEVSKQLGGLEVLMLQEAKPRDPSSKPEIRISIPFQRFFVEKTGSRSKVVEGLHYKLGLDRNHELKTQHFDRDHKPNWHYQNTERMVSFTLENGKIKAHSTQDQLYLVYLYLGQGQEDLAEQTLKEIELRGTPEELESAFWILKHLPSGKDQENFQNPKQIAVKTRLLWMLAKLGETSKKPITIPSPAGFDPIDDNVTYARDYYKELQDFYQNLPKTLAEHYEQYLDTLNNIPKSMRLNQVQEHQLLSYYMLGHARLMGKDFGTDDWSELFANQDPTHSLIAWRWANFQRSLVESLEEKKQLDAFISQGPWVQEKIFKNKVLTLKLVYEDKNQFNVSASSIDINIGQTTLKQVIGFLAEEKKEGSTKSLADLSMNLKFEDLQRDYVGFYQALVKADPPAKARAKIFLEAGLKHLALLDDRDPEKNKLPYFLILWAVTCGAQFKTLEEYKAEWERDRKAWEDRGRSGVEPNPWNKFLLERIQSAFTSTGCPTLSIQKIRIKEPKRVKLEPIKLATLAPHIPPGKRIKPRLDVIRIIEIKDIEPLVKILKMKQASAEAIQKIKKALDDKKPGNIREAFENEKKAEDEVADLIFAAQAKMDEQMQAFFVRNFDVFSAEAKDKLFKVRTQKARIKDELEKLFSLEFKAILSDEQKVDDRLNELGELSETQDIEKILVLALLLERGDQHALAKIPFSKRDEFLTLARTYFKAHFDEQWLAKMAEKPGEELPARRAWIKSLLDYNVSKTLETDLLQYAKNLALYSEQQEHLDDLLGLIPVVEEESKGDEKSQEPLARTVHMPMGGGKTAIIIPSLAYAQATGERLVVVQVPSPLLASVSADLSRTSNQVFGQDPIKIEFDRNSDCSPQALYRIQSLLEQAIGYRQYIVTTKSTRDAFHMKLQDLLIQAQEVREKITHQEKASVDEKEKESQKGILVKQLQVLEKQIQILKRINGIFNEAYAIIDEAHETYAIKDETRYTFGREISMPQEQVQDLMLFFENFFQFKPTGSSKSFGELIRKDASGSMPDEKKLQEQFKEFFDAKLYEEAFLEDEEEESALLPSPSPSAEPSLGLPDSKVLFLKPESKDKKDEAKAEEKILVLDWDGVITSNRVNFDTQRLKFIFQDQKLIEALHQSSLTLDPASDWRSAQKAKALELFAAKTAPLESKILMEKKQQLAMAGQKDYVENHIQAYNTAIEQKRLELNNISQAIAQKQSQKQWAVNSYPSDPPYFYPFIQKLNQEIDQLNAQYNGLNIQISQYKEGILKLQSEIAKQELLIQESLERQKKTEAEYLEINQMSLVLERLMDATELSFWSEASQKPDDPHVSKPDDKAIPAMMKVFEQVKQAGVDPAKQAQALGPLVAAISVFGCPPSCTPDQIKQWGPLLWKAYLAEKQKQGYKIGIAYGGNPEERIHILPAIIKRYGLPVDCIEIGTLRPAFGSPDKALMIANLVQACQMHSPDVLFVDDSKPTVEAVMAAQIRGSTRYKHLQVHNPGYANQGGNPFLSFIQDEARVWSFKGPFSTDMPILFDSVFPQASIQPQLGERKVIVDDEEYEGQEETREFLFFEAKDEKGKPASSPEKLPVFLTLAARQRALLYREVFQKFLTYALNKKLFVEYGPPLAADPRFAAGLAVPYKANNVPSPNQFSNYLETAVLTLFMVYSQGVNRYFFDQLIAYYKQKDREERLERLSHTGASESVFLLFTTDAEKIFKTLFGEELSLINPEDAKAMDALFNELRTKPELILDALRNHILPKIKVHEQELITDSVTHGALYGVRALLSGTLRSHRTFDRRVRHQATKTLAVNGVIRKHIIQQSRVEVVPRARAPAYLKTLVQEFKDSSLSAIIDTGAHFNGVSNVEVAKLIRSAILEKKQETRLKWVLFYNEAGILCALSTEKPDDPPLLLKGSAESELEAKLGKPEGRFTYYDQSHITGSDIRQPKGARAVMTVSKETKESDFQQGAMRMRDLAGTQKLTLVISPEFNQEILVAKPRAHFVRGVAVVTPEELTHWTYQVETSLLVPDHQKAAQARMKDCIHEDLMKRIQDLDLKKQEDFFAKAQSFFMKKQSIDYKQFESTWSMQDSEIFLKNYAEALMKAWEQVLRDSVITPTGAEKANLDQALQDIVRAALPQIEAQVLSIAAAPGDAKAQDRGAQAESQVQTEVQTQKETKKEITAHDPFVQPRAFSDDFITKLVRDIKQLPSKPYAQSVLEDRDAKDLKLLNLSEQLFASPEYLSLDQGRSRAGFSRYTKPIQELLWIKRGDNLTLLIVAPEEAHYLRTHWKEINCAGAEIWLANMGDFTLEGTKPSHIEQNSQYQALREQVLFLNGNIECLMRSKDFRWLSQDSAQKLDFLKKHIARAHLDLSIQELEQRLLYSGKVYREVQEKILLQGYPLTKELGDYPPSIKSSPAFKNYLKVVHLIWKNISEPDHDSIRATIRAGAAVHATARARLAPISSEDEIKKAQNNLPLHLQGLVKDYQDRLKALKRLSDTKLSDSQIIEHFDKLFYAIPSADKPQQLLGEKLLGIRFSEFKEGVDKRKILVDRKKQVFLKALVKIPKGREADNIFLIFQTLVQHELDKDPEIQLELKKLLKQILLSDPRKLCKAELLNILPEAYDAFKYLVKVFEKSPGSRFNSKEDLDHCLAFLERFKTAGFPSSQIELLIQVYMGVYAKGSEYKIGDKNSELHLLFSDPAPGLMALLKEPLDKPKPNIILDYLIFESKDLKPTQVNLLAYVQKTQKQYQALKDCFDEIKLTEPTHRALIFEAYAKGNPPERTSILHYLKILLTRGPHAEDKKIPALQWLLAQYTQDPSQPFWRDLLQQHLQSELKSIHSGDAFVRKFRPLLKLKAFEDFLARYPQKHPWLNFYQRLRKLDPDSNPQLLLAKFSSLGTYLESKLQGLTKLSDLELDFIMAAYFTADAKALALAVDPRVAPQGALLIDALQIIAQSQEQLRDFIVQVQEQKPDLLNQIGKASKALFMSYSPKDSKGNVRTIDAMVSVRSSALSSEEKEALARKRLNQIFHLQDAEVFRKTKAQEKREAEEKARAEEESRKAAEKAKAEKAKAEEEKRKSEEKIKEEEKRKTEEKLKLVPLGVDGTGVDSKYLVRALGVAPPAAPPVSHSSLATSSVTTVTTVVSPVTNPPADRSVDLPKSKQGIKPIWNLALGGLYLGNAVLLILGLGPSHLLLTLTTSFVVSHLISISLGLGALGLALLGCYKIYKYFRSKEQMQTLAPASLIALGLLALALGLGAVLTAMLGIHLFGALNLACILVTTFSLCCFAIQSFSQARQMMKAQKLSIAVVDSSASPAHLAEPSAPHSSVSPTGHHLPSNSNGGVPKVGGI